jgi:transcriptional regulator with XRE-family HTH domain
MTPLRAYRKTNKLTLAEVADMIGISEGQLSRIERFGTDALGIALKLAALTKTKPEQFQRIAGE